MADNGFISGLGGLLGNVFRAIPQANQTETMVVSPDQYKPSLSFLNKFRGKNVLVTGASGGIGAAVCLKLMETEVDRLCMFMRDVD
jgi:NAD(P)-dependent dehydrogenase (short-subunit alcohol dehydrogenase family)